MSFLFQVKYMRWSFSSNMTNENLKKNDHQDMTVHEKERSMTWSKSKCIWVPLFASSTRSSLKASNEKSDWLTVAVTDVWSNNQSRLKTLRSRPHPSLPPSDQLKRRKREKILIKRSQQKLKYASYGLLDSPKFFV